MSTLWASIYAVLAALAPGSFNQPMTPVSALYFTVAVFATVGFGDLTAQTATAPAAGHPAGDHRPDHPRDRRAGVAWRGCRGTFR